MKIVQKIDGKLRVTHLKVPLILVVISLMLVSCDNPEERTQLLVFTKTEGFRHASIPSGVKALEALGAEKDFDIHHTENSSVFQRDSLEKYQAVVFLSTSGDVFNKQQQEALQSYIQNGGGFAGIHAATTTEYEWPWYGKMIGAYFDGHPEVQQAAIEVVDTEHTATEPLPERWERTDEWYNFYSFNPEVNTLLNLDEESYNGGIHGEDHPIAWYHDFDGGRIFYTALGHTHESYSEPLFMEHVWGGIRYVLSRDE